jgi:hypothetical protein
MKCCYASTQTAGGEPVHCDAAAGVLGMTAERIMRKSGKAAKWAARSERLTAALRENLKRRKAQARGRADDSAQGEVPDSGGAGQAERKDPDFRRNRGTK